MSRIGEGLEVEQTKAQDLIPLHGHTERQSLNRVLSNMQRSVRKKRGSYHKLDPASDSSAEPLLLGANRHTLLIISASEGTN
jgi:hypothetical protein